MFISWSRDSPCRTETEKNSNHIYTRWINHPVSSVGLFWNSKGSALRWFAQPFRTTWEEAGASSGDKSQQCCQNTPRTCGGHLLAAQFGSVYFWPVVNVSSVYWWYLDYAPIENGFLPHNSSVLNYFYRCLEGLGTVISLATSLAQIRYALLVCFCWILTYPIPIPTLVALQPADYSMKP